MNLKLPTNVSTDEDALIIDWHTDDWRASYYRGLDYQGDVCMGEQEFFFIIDGATGKVEEYSGIKARRKMAEFLASE